MATSQSAALKHWTRIIQRWPVDKVRPENVAFQKIMQQRVQKVINPAAATSPNVKANEALVTPSATAKFDEARELQQSNSLYSLLEDRYAKQFPLSNSLRSPASNPTYYDDLVQEMQEAPSRSWFDRIVKRVRGSLRLT